MENNTFDRERSDTSGHYTEEILAQSMCQSLAVSPDKAWERVFAVGKYCSYPHFSADCNHICVYPTLHTDHRTVNSRWSCIGAFHVYYGRPATRQDGNINTATLGLKSARQSCDDAGCGPNFCCCAAIDSYQ